MRKLVLLIAFAGASGFALMGATAAAVASPPPVSLSGTTNVHGQKDLSSKRNAKLTLEQDDFYFSPTFIKVKPGEKLTLTVKNEGKAEHTFTSSVLHVNKTIAPDKTKKIQVTIPKKGGTIQFHCNFHQSMGMQGAFYTAASSQGSSASSATISLADTKLGKVLVDSSGRTLYERDSDTATMVTCTGTCANLWPPVTVTDKPSTGRGLDASKLGTISGANGTQVTYGGHPLYRFMGDQAAGDTRGQGVAGMWWAVGADGNKITTM